MQEELDKVAAGFGETICPTSPISDASLGYDPNQATVMPGASGLGQKKQPPVTAMEPPGFDPNMATVPPSLGKFSGIQDPQPIGDGATVAPGLGHLITDEALNKTFQLGKKQSGPTQAGVAKETQANPGGKKYPQVPGYEIYGELGRGGMGVVYRAKQRGLGRVVALKMIFGGANVPPEIIDRFKLEAQAVAALKHPAIVQVYEVSEFNGAPFFSLEFVDGGPMDRKIDGTPQSPMWTAKILSQLAQAMDYAHQNQILHRDLKPANVLLTKEGDPKITDFGLAKKMDSDDGQTQDGSIMGTPSYMPPEQAEGRIKEIGPAADIYSLGAILYECLTGRPPFKDANYLDTLKQVLTLEPVAPSTLQPNTPIDLQTISLKCLEKDPAKRYATAGELADELIRYIKGEPILARPVSLFTKTVKWAKRNRTKSALIAVSAAFFITLILGMAGYIVRSNREDNRLAALRKSTQPELLKAQTLFEEKKFAPAKEQLNKLLAELKNEINLDEIKTPAAELLSQAEKRIQANQNMLDFAGQYDEALFQSADVLGNAAQSKEQSVLHAANALEKVGIDWQKDTSFSLRLPDYLSSKEKVKLAQEAFELVILIARQMTLRLPGTSNADFKEGNNTALALLEKGKGLSQGSHVFHLTVADVLLNLGRGEEAAKELALAKGIEPASGWEFFLLGQRALGQNDLASALEFFTRSQRIDPGLFWSNFFVAVCNAKADEWEKVGPVMNACIGVKPDLGFSYLLRGIADVKTVGKKPGAGPQVLQEALADFSKARDLGVPEFHILVNRGVAYFDLGHLDLAKADFEKAMTLNPSDTRPMANLALVFRKERKNLEAIELFNKCIRANPNEGEFFHWRGLAFLDLTPPEKAKALADFIAEGNWRIQPKDKAAAYLLAVDLLYSQGQLDKALELSALAVNLDPASPGAQLMTGLVLVEQNKYAEAVSAFNKYFALHNPKKDGGLDPRAYLGRGNALRGLNQLGPALADLSRGVELLPSDMKARNRRAMLLNSAWKKLVEADISRILESADVDPLEKSQAYQVRGYIRATQNDLAGAVGDAQAALKEAQPSLPLYLNVAGIYSVVHGKIALRQESTPESAQLLLSYRKNSFDFLDKAWDLSPPTQRMAIWLQAIETDDSFDSLRKGQDYAQQKARWLAK